jgi:hypothetical protein
MFCENDLAIRQTTVIHPMELKTRAPTVLLPEYRCLQVVRKDWVNLNGPWNYCITDCGTQHSDDFKRKILAPFPLKWAFKVITMQWIRLIIQLLAKGLLFRTIARQLHRTRKTINAYVCRFRGSGIRPTP